MIYGHPDFLDKGEEIKKEKPEEGLVKIMSPKEAQSIFSESDKKEIQEIAAVINAELISYTSGVKDIYFAHPIPTKVFGAIAASCTKEGWIVSYQDLPSSDGGSRIELRPTSDS